MIHDHDENEQDDEYHYLGHDNYYNDNNCNEDDGHEYGRDLYNDNVHYG